MSKLKTTVVLFNLGGPADQASVRPFLFNLFHDKSILGVPQPMRFFLALLISTLRAKKARGVYAVMGGGSPILNETEAQAKALLAELEMRQPDRQWSVMPCMRYWRPFLEDVAQKVEAQKADDVVLLPLYPQFSTTTTASSLRGWKRHYRGSVRVRGVCCYPTQTAFIAAHVARIRAAWTAAGQPKNTRLLFSAHGLPEKVIAAGDPYQMQVEATAKAIAAQLPEFADWQVCYQSRVGPLKWIGPSTEDALAQAAADQKGVVLCPIAFVSEHVETLVELDHEYAEKAAQMGLTPYIRVPALQTEPDFITALADMTLETLGRDDALAPSGFSGCSGFDKCPCKKARA